MFAYGFASDGALRWMLGAGCVEATEPGAGAES